MSVELKGKHKCIERNLESDCPICSEYMFTSTTTIIFMVCMVLSLWYAWTRLDGTVDLSFIKRNGVSLLRRNAATAYTIHATRTTSRGRTSAHFV
jgi:hypothetical protein